MNSDIVKSMCKVTRGGLRDRNEQTPWGNAETDVVSCRREFRDEVRNIRRWGYISYPAYGYAQPGCMVPMISSHPCGN